MRSILGSLGLFSSNSSGGCNCPPTAPVRKPNSYRFSILNVQKYGKYFVSMLKYPDAETFEGNKVLVTTFRPDPDGPLDPHFSGAVGVIARFPPTLTGWVHATRFAEMIAKDR